MILLRHLSDRPFRLDPAAIGLRIGSKCSPIDLGENAQIIEIRCDPVPFLYRICSEVGRRRWKGRFGSGFLAVQ